MGYINLWRMNIQQRNSCTSTLISLSDVQPPLVYKSHILNGSINKLYVSEKKHGAWAFIRINTVCTEIRKSIHCIFFFFCSISKCLTGFIWYVGGTHKFLKNYLFPFLYDKDKYVFFFIYQESYSQTNFNI